MDPKTPQYWAKLFWEYFTPQFELSNPVYLTFDTGLIRKLYSKDFPEVPLENKKIDAYFNAAHAKLLCLEKVKATLTPLALEKNIILEDKKNKFSCAIVLAAQQILVVEEMTKEETKKFTHDAYFPRYREKLNFVRREGLKHNNPIESLDFYKIWSILRDEILSIPGANNYSVTFKEGNGTKNKTRNFPISQALFSQDDLQKLYEKVPDKQRASNSFCTPDSLLLFFNHNK